MELYSWIFFGIFTTIIVYFFQPAQSNNLYVSLLIGISGGILGGLFAKLIFDILIRQTNILPQLFAISGALILLYIERISKIN